MVLTGIEQVGILVTLWFGVSATCIHKNGREKGIKGQRERTREREREEGDSFTIRNKHLLEQSIHTCTCISL